MRTSGKLFSFVLAIWALAHPFVTQAGTGEGKESPSAIAACSALQDWRKTKSSEILKQGRPGCERRDKVYLAFADFFWSFIDRLHAEKKPEKTADILENIRAAFLEGAHRYEKKINSFGIELLLVIESDNGTRASDVQVRRLTASDLKQTKRLSDHPDVQPFLKKPKTTIGINFSRKGNEKDFYNIVVFQNMPMASLAITGRTSLNTTVDELLEKMSSPTSPETRGLRRKLDCEKGLK